MFRRNPKNRPHIPAASVDMGGDMPPEMWAVPGELEGNLSPKAQDEIRSFPMNFLHFGFDAISIIDTETGVITPGRKLGDGGPPPTKDLPFII